MIKRVYKMEDLTDSAEMYRSGPPWWLHVMLFGLIMFLISAISILSAFLERGIKH